MTTPSYRKINFSLRPAKGAERKMFVETVGRLLPFSILETYRYIGFGSPYFSDFSLVHRRLGISDMVCIEQQEEDSERFEFKPTIQVHRLEIWAFLQNSLDAGVGRKTDGYMARL